MTPGRVLAAMSGGVDSAAAALITLREGHDCVGATMQLIAGGGGRCCSLADINDARAAAWKLGIPHYVMNYTEAFTRWVIEPFIAAYERGETPNPCVECNRHLKFRLLLHRAAELEAAFLVTGHYARIHRDPSGRFLLKKGRDPAKDQSYVLYMMNQDALGRVRFPLGDITKAEARRIASEAGLANAAKAESQDICFVEEGRYAEFIEERTGRKAPEGDILDPGGKIIGRHRGLIRYTLGQRRGLGVSAAGPLYVAARDTARNTLTAAGEEALYAGALTVRDINLIACDTLDRPLRLFVKTRYLQREQAAVVEQTGPDSVRVEFDKPQRALTPGQAAVFYDGDVVVGGGAIHSVG